MQNWSKIKGSKGAIFVVLALLLATQAALASDAPLTPMAALERLLSAEKLQEEWFSPLVLQQITLAQLEQIIAQLTGNLGAFQGVSESGSTLLALYERGEIPTTIGLDDQGRIATILFQPPRLGAVGLDEATAGFGELPGSVSLIVLSNQGELASIEPDLPLAVGSAFKLAVLAAAETKVRHGELAWDSVVRFDDAWRSLPSGMLQEWPAGSPLTLHTLAALMISISDNTATDALISIVGREFVELFSPRNAPFLTTREAFVLKNPQNAETLERFRGADAAGRRAILEEVNELPLPDPLAFANGPVALDVEWYLTGRELCGLMAAVRHLDLVTINPGLADPGDWSRVAFKGGSEPGVLNLTTWLERGDDFYCVSATWNDKAALDELRFYSLYSSLIEALKTL